MKHMMREDFKMGDDFFNYIPPEITLDILSRLPAPTVMRCKCVCKPWLNLFATPEFVKSHLSKLVPGLVLYDWQTEPKPYTFVEFVDEVDCNYDKQHHWDIVFNFKLPFCKPLYGSANGLLYLFGGPYGDDFDIVICNPFTREYITVPPPMPYSGSPFHYGFGVSRVSGQYKLVQICIKPYVLTSPPYGYDQTECQVYTVGTGLWIRISSAGSSPLTNAYDSIGAFLNGNFHWVAFKGSSFLISCLDLETEIFSTLPFPPVALVGPHKYRNLSVLRDCLCVCESSWDEGSSNCDIDIWLMKKYGDEKSWRKEFIIRKVSVDESLANVRPVKVFKDGSILMDHKGCKMLFYSSKTNTIQQVILFGEGLEDVFGCMAIYSPSFLPLKTFVIERVTSF